MLAGMKNSYRFYTARASEAFSADTRYGMMICFSCLSTLSEGINSSFSNPILTGMKFFLSYLRNFQSQDLRRVAGFIAGSDEMRQSRECIAALLFSKRYHVPLYRTHVRQELAVRRRFAQLVDQQFHGFHRRERVQHFTQHPDTRQVFLGNKQLFLTGSGALNINCR